MWVTVLHFLQWPTAIFCGFIVSRLARSRGHSIWLAYGVALVPGLAAALIASALANTGQNPWIGFLIWAAWAGFGAVQGWYRGRRTASITTLNLGGRHR